MFLLCVLNIYKKSLKYLVFYYYIWSCNFFDTKKEEMNQAPVQCLIQPINTGVYFKFRL